MRNGLNYRSESYISSGLDGLYFKIMSIQRFITLSAHQNYLGAFKNATTRA